MHPSYFALLSLLVCAVRPNPLSRPDLLSLSKTRRGRRRRGKRKRKEEIKIMSLVLLANVCSHLQNASAARLGLTSVPSTTMIHTILLALQTSGYVGSITIGGPQPPAPGKLAPVLDPFQHQNESSHSITPRDDPKSSSPPPSPSPITQENVASRRLWVGMKYYRNEPVLRKIGLVSKPTRRIWLKAVELEALARGDQRSYVPGLRGVGESLYVTTDRGVMEIRECVERRIGGMLMCRVNSPF